MSKDYPTVDIAMVAIANNDKSLFYLQQKDETHPVSEYRLKYTLFGGAIEKNEKAISAIKRELHEELEKHIADLIIRSLSTLEPIRNLLLFIPEAKKYVNISLFSSILSDNELTMVSKAVVKEGKQGSLVKHEDLFKLPLITSCKEILEEFLIIKN